MLNTKLPSYNIFGEDYYNKFEKREVQRTKNYGINRLLQNKKIKKSINQNCNGLTKKYPFTSPNSNDRKFKGKKNKGHYIKKSNKRINNISKYNNKQKDITKNSFNEIEVIEINDSSSNESSVKKYTSVIKSRKRKKVNDYNENKNSNLNKIKMNVSQRDNYKEKKYFERKGRNPLMKVKKKIISKNKEIIQSEKYTPNKEDNKNKKTYFFEENKKIRIKNMDDFTLEIEKSRINNYYNFIKSNDKNIKKEIEQNSVIKLNKEHEKYNDFIFEKNKKKKGNKIDKKLMKVSYNKAQNKHKKNIKNEINCKTNRNIRHHNYKKSPSLKQDIANMNNIMGDFSPNKSQINKNIIKENLNAKYSYCIYEINEPLFIVKLKKIIIKDDDRYINSKIEIKREDNKIENSFCLLNHKRKRNKKKTSNNKKEIKIKEEEIKIKKEKIKKEEKTKISKLKEKKIKNEKFILTKMEKISKKNCKNKMEKNPSKNKTEEEILDDLQKVKRSKSVIYNTINLRGSSNTRQIKKQKEKMSKNKEYDSSISKIEKGNKYRFDSNYICIPLKTPKKNKIKNNENLINQIQIQENNFNISSNIKFNNFDDFNSNIKKFDYMSFSSLVGYRSSMSSDNYGYFPFEDDLSFSLPIDDYRKIKFFSDISYFSRNSNYIKYHPIDEFFQSVSNEKSTSLSKIGKTEKINFCKNEQMNIDNDNEINEFIYSDEEKDYLLPILSIPRIKPSRKEYILKIKNQFDKIGMKFYQTDNEIMKNEEKSLYIDSFILYDNINDIKVYIPCYRNNIRMEEFIRKKNLEIIEFQEDNDIDTDEEQLELEIDRNYKNFINFMKKVETEKNYIKKNLHRKQKNN